MAGVCLTVLLSANSGKSIEAVVDADELVVSIDFTTNLSPDGSNRAVSTMEVSRDEVRKFAESLLKIIN